MMMAGVLLTLTLAGAAPPPLVCGGPYVPPIDYDDRGKAVILEYAVAIAPIAHGQEVIESAARSQLVNRLCRLADSSTCAPLAAATSIWQLSKDKDGQRMCAMAVIRSTALDAWRMQLDPDLPQQLIATFTDILPPVVEKPKVGLFSGKVKPRAVVLLSSISDLGAPGGVRADWLLSQVRAALTTLKVDMVEPPKGWNGAGLPKDVEFVVRGTMIERVDAKKQLPVIDVAFSMSDRKRKVTAAKPITIPAAIAPMPPRLVDTPPPAAGLQLHVETRAGGSLCPGDFTQLHVTNETIDPLYVRVFNLDANGEALLLFPNESKPDDLVLPGKSVALAEGFSVEGGAGDRERYVAIGAKSPDGLGVFTEARGWCRYAPKDAKKLNKGQFLDLSLRATAGFTLLDDVRCQKPIALPDRAMQVQALASLPICPPIQQ